MSFVIISDNVLPSKNFGIPPKAWPCTLAMLL